MLLGCRKGQGARPPLRLGYFPNITHSQALIGVERGDFAKALEGDCLVEPRVFNAGPSAIEALFAGQLDIAYVGPNPAINGYVKSQGKALRIIAGATSGGAAFVVRKEAHIKVPKDLSGKTFASPQIGNTQDVALRAYLRRNNLTVVERGGDVRIVPTDNPQILDLFRLGQIDGAWLPEPWATRLIVEGSAEIFVDEGELWPSGDFVTAQVIASPQILQLRPSVVSKFLAAHVQITLWERTNTNEALRLVNNHITKLTGKPLPAPVIQGAWSRMRVTYDPIRSSLVANADAAFQAGFLKAAPQLDGIYDLGFLQAVLVGAGLAPLS